MMSMEAAAAVIDTYRETQETAYRTADSTAAAFAAAEVAASDACNKARAAVDAGSIEVGSVASLTMAANRIVQAGRTSINCDEAVVNYVGTIVAHALKAAVTSATHRHTAAVAATETATVATANLADSAVIATDAANAATALDARWKIFRTGKNLPTFEGRNQGPFRVTQAADASSIQAVVPIGDHASSATKLIDQLMDTPHAHTSINEAAENSRTDGVQKTVALLNASEAAAKDMNAKEALATKKRKAATKAKEVVRSTKLESDEAIQSSKDTELRFQEALHRATSHENDMIIAMELNNKRTETALEEARRASCATASKSRDDTFDACGRARREDFIDAHGHKDNHAATAAIDATLTTAIAAIAVSEFTIRAAAAAAAVNAMANDNNKSPIPHNTQTDHFDRAIVFVRTAMLAANDAACTKDNGHPTDASNHQTVTATDKSPPKKRKREVPLQTEQMCD